MPNVLKKVNYKMRKISFKNISQKLSNGFKRFPLSFCFIVILTILFLLESHNIINNNTINWRIYFFLFTAIVWVSSVTTYTEDNCSKKGIIIAKIITTILCAINAYFLPTKPKENLIIFQIALQVTGFLSLFFAPFIKKKNTESEFWNYSKNIVKLLIITGLFSIVLVGGLELAIQAISNLFNLDNSLINHLREDILILFGPSFSFIYFLCNLPYKEEKYITETTVSKTFRILALYILLPIASIYITILYVYLAKIIITWTLPDGMVTYLVTATMVIYCLSVFFTYPLHCKNENKVATFIAKWLGIIVLPLNILMSIGIIYRINQYDITINRLYVLILNLWFYGLIILFTLSKSRKIKWALISFCAVFVITSFGPWSVYNVTYKTILNNIKSIVTDDVLSKEKNKEEWESYLNSLKEEDKNKLIEQTNYFMKNFSEKDKLYKIFGTKENYGTFNEASLDHGSYKYRGDWFSIHGDFAEENLNQIDISEYNSFLLLKKFYYNTEDYIKFSTIDSQRIVTFTNKESSIDIPESKLLDMVNDNESYEKRIIQKDNYQAIIIDICGYKENETINSIESFEIYVFYK